MNLLPSFSSVVVCLFLPLAAGGAEPSAVRRVVSLAPSVTETVQALGFGDRLAARTRYCPSGNTEQGVVILEDMVQPSVEQLLGLRPDLVLASDPTPELVVAQMRKVRLRVERLPTTGVDSVVANLRRIGELLGEPAKGDELAQRVAGELRNVEALVSQVAADSRPRTVLFYGTDTAFCAGAGSFTGELLERAGGRNVAGNTTSAWPGLNRERLLAWDPEVILVSLTGDPAELLAARAEAARWKNDGLWSRVQAVREGRIVFITGSLLMIPGPRIGEAAGAVAAALHPGLFPPESVDELHFLEP